MGPEGRNQNTVVLSSIEINAWVDFLPKLFGECIKLS